MSSSDGRSLPRGLPTAGIRGRNLAGAAATINVTGMPAISRPALRRGKYGHDLFDGRGPRLGMRTNVCLAAPKRSDAFAHAHGQIRRIEVMIGAGIFDESEAGAPGEVATGARLGPVVVGTHQHGERHAGAPIGQPRDFAA